MTVSPSPTVEGKTAQAARQALESVGLYLKATGATDYGSDTVALKQAVAAGTSEMCIRDRYELAYDLSSIEEQAAASGAMVKPQNGQIIYVDLSEPDNVEFFREETGRTGIAGAVESIRSICSEILEYFQ